jgi:hypothetical protein
MLSISELPKIADKFKSRLEENSQRRAEEFVNSLFGDSQKKNPPKLKTQWDSKNNKAK